MTKLRRAALALGVIAVVAVTSVGGGTAASEQAKTVTIGWAYDGVGNMAAYDGPALATAKERVAQLNKLKSNTTKFKLITCNTQGNKPAIAKACASKLVSQGADIIMTTCDVDYAAPVVQYAIDRGKLTVAACI
jgi:ABC-type branched-subunit amino acid transport system substrate-binding protein